MSSFPERLKYLRKEKELTQDELAKRLEISRSSLAMYEQGNREPDFETQESIADYFNVNLDYLMGRSNVRTPILEMNKIGLLTELEENLVLQFRSLSEKGKENILSYLGYVSQLPEEI